MRELGSEGSEGSDELGSDEVKEVMYEEGRRKKEEGRRITSIANSIDYFN